MKQLVSILFVVLLVAVCSACGQKQTEIPAHEGVAESASGPAVDTDSTSVAEEDREPSSPESGDDAARMRILEESQAAAQSAEGFHPIPPENQAGSSAADPEGEPRSAVEFEQEPAQESSPSLPDAPPEASAAQEIVVADDARVLPGNDGLYAVNITVGNEVFAAKFYDNDSARVLIDQMPMILDMQDFAGQEKVLGLDYDFPSAARQTPSTIRTGDIYLYSGSSLVLFYTTFSNSYSYVPIGYIEDTAGWASALGDGNVLVAFHTP